MCAVTKHIYNLHWIEYFKRSMQIAFLAFFYVRFNLCVCFFSLFFFWFSLLYAFKNIYFLHVSLYTEEWKRMNAILIFNLLVCMHWYVKIPTWEMIFDCWVFFVCSYKKKRKKNIQWDKERGREKKRKRKRVKKKMPNPKILKIDYGCDERQQRIEKR